MEIFQNLSKTKNSKLKGYSLLEVTVSLAIVGICTVIMLNFLILSFRLSLISLNRSYIREELASVINQIAKDFKNADVSPTCGQQGSLDYCDIKINGTIYRWIHCNNATMLCKSIYNTATSSYDQIFNTPDNIIISTVNFEPGYSVAGAAGLPNIIMTLSASHANPSLGINNVIRQASFSVRNYTL